MKRIPILSMMVCLLTSTILLSCNDKSDEEAGTIISMSSYGNDLEDFINTISGNNYGGNNAYVGVPKGDFYCDSILVNMGCDYYIVNSQEQMNNVFRKEIEKGIKIPDIDFSKNTFIIGSKTIPNDRVVGIKNQVLYQLSTEYKIKFTCSYVTHEDRDCEVHYVNFWGLYPKIKEMPLRIEFE